MTSTIYKTDVKITILIRGNIFKNFFKLSEIRIFKALESVFKSRKLICVNMKGCGNFYLGYYLCNITSFW